MKINLTIILRLNNNTNKKSFPTGRTFLFVIRYMVEPTRSGMFYFFLGRLM